MTVNPHFDFGLQLQTYQAVFVVKVIQFLGASVLSRSERVLFICCFQRQSTNLKMCGPVLWLL